MARKLIAPVKKWDYVIRILKGEMTADEVARRLGVTSKAVNCWRREYLAAHPEAANLSTPPPPKLKIAPTPAPGASPVSVPPADPAPGPLSGDGLAPGAGSEFDEAAAAAARGADGELKEPKPNPAADAPPPGQSAPSNVIPPEVEDMAMVELYGNMLMGFGTRCMIWVGQWRLGVSVDRKPLESLFLLTEGEKAALKPASRHLADRIRKILGSSENASYVGAGMAVLAGAGDRFMAVKDAFVAAVERQDALNAARGKA